MSKKKFKKNKQTSVRVNKDLEQALKDEYGLTTQELLDKAFLRLFDIEEEIITTIKTKREKKVA